MFPALVVYTDFNIIPEKGGCQESYSSLAFIMKKLFMKTINCCGLI